MQGMSGVSTHDELERIHSFLVELAALTRKYRIAIGGCGCHGSPYLDLKPHITDGRSGYSMHNKYLQWVDPRDEYVWDECSDDIARDLAKPTKK